MAMKCFHVLLAIVTYSILSDAYEKRILLNDPNLLQQELHGMQVTIQNLTATVAGLQRQLTEQNQLIHNQEIQIQMLINNTGYATSICPDGFVKHLHSCYKFYDQTLTWPGALRFCDAVGAHLVRLETSEEFTFLKNWMESIKSEMTSGAILVAGFQAHENRQWVWAHTMEVIKILQWYPGQPSQSPTEDCLMMVKSYGFLYADVVCDNTDNFVCEINLSNSV